MGIMLCLDCSGRHRRMGTHISFVRSSDLDQFTPAQLLRVNVGGNGRARRHFQEKGLTGGIDYTSPIVTAYNAMLADEVDRILSSVTPKRVPITVTAPIATTKPVVPAVASPAVQQIKPASSPRVSPASKSSAASPVRGQKLMDFDFDLDNFVSPNILIHSGAHIRASQACTRGACCGARGVEAGGGGQGL